MFPKNTCQNWPILLSFLFVYSLTILLFSSWQTSPLFPMYGDDSVIFILMGRGLLEGHVPYRDLFDHKGPILWIIEAIALSIYNGRLGVFMLQVINMTLASLGMYKLSEKFFNSSLSLLSACLMPTLSLFLYDGGNHCEEFCLPFIVTAYYLFFDTIHEEKLSVWKTLLIGVCFAMVFHIRINDGISQFVAIFMLWIAHHTHHRTCKSLLLRLCTGFAGFMVVTLPICIYYDAHNALYDMVYGSLFFNINYAENSIIKSGLINKLTLFAGALTLLTLYLRIVSGKRSEAHRDRLLMLNFILITQIATLVLMGKTPHFHYAIVIMPCICMIIALLAENVHPKHKLSKRLIYPISTLALLSLLLIRYQHSNTKRGAEMQLHTMYSKLYEKVGKQDKDSIWNYKTTLYSIQFFYHNNILPQNRMLAFYDITAVHDNAATRAQGGNDSFWREKDRLNDVKPKYVLVSSASKQGTAITSLEKNYMPFSRQSVDYSYTPVLFKRIYNRLMASSEAPPETITLTLYKRRD